MRKSAWWSIIGAFYSVSALAVDIEPGYSPELGYIVVHGEIVAGRSYQVLENALSKLPTDTIVVLNSPGGNPIEAIKMGRMIRARGLETMVVEGDMCASACSFVFMGGIERFADPRTVGVHRMSLPDGFGTAKEGMQLTQEVLGQILDYLHEMGVDAELVRLMMNTPGSEMHWLSSSELRQFGIGEPF